uniref:Uncharacterized protein n=1 Tax=Anopheles atroparvus TaxID=41427 RepID=A0AAG5D1N4_ANOAO
MGQYKFDTFFRLFASLEPSRTRLLIIKVYRTLAQLFPYVGTSKTSSTSVN